jgi:rare lipoprotein A
MRDWKQNTWACLLLALSIAAYGSTLVYGAEEQASALVSLQHQSTANPMPALTQVANVAATEPIVKDPDLKKVALEKVTSLKKEATPLEAKPFVAQHSALQVQSPAMVNHYLKSMPDTLTLSSAFQQEKSYLLRTVYNKKLEEAGFYINDEEVFRFRSKLGFLTPYLRSKQVIHRLNVYAKGDYSYKDIHLKRQADGNFHLMMGTHILTVVDEKTAQVAHMPLDTLAHLWMKQLRLALGEAPSADPVFSLTQSGRFIAKGLASWYGPGFYGRKSADGSRFNMNALTAAHKTLPFGTKVRVINESNGKSCVVKITDRGPYGHHRVIDLSKGAAQAIGAMSSGIAKVRLEVLD